MNQRTSTLLIQTPEGISFSLLLAGPVVRCMAWLVDFFCVLVLVISIGKAFSIFGIINPDFAQAVLGVLYFTIHISYGIILEWLWRGQTIGKRLFRLSVVDEQGLRRTFSQIAIRNLLRFVDSLPMFYLVGGVACLLTRNAQRLGDIAASTIVIRNPPILVPDTKQLLAGKFNSFRQYPHLAARLRQRVSASEANLALQGLLRREQFEDSARIELFREIAAHFKRSVQFPPETMDGITDEQYLRNVVDILFNSKAVS